jgi:hypothetical protein
MYIFSFEIHKNVINPNEHMNKNNPGTVTWLNNFDA